MVTLKLRPREERRARAGHLWIYSNEIDTDATFRTIDPGSLCRVVDGRGKPIGTGYVNPRTLLAVRLLSGDVHAEIDAAWFDRRLQSQLGARTGFAALATRITVHMESVSESSEAAIALYQLVVEATGSVPDLKDRITRLNRSYAEGMRLHLLEAQDDGSLRPGVDIERHALAIVSAMHGLAIQALIRGDTPSLSADSRYIAEIHVAAVARRPFPPGRGEAPYD